MALKRYIQDINYTTKTRIGETKTIADFVEQCLSDAGVLVGKTEETDSSVYKAIFSLDPDFLGASQLEVYTGSTTTSSNAGVIIALRQTSDSGILSANATNGRIFVTTSTASPQIGVCALIGEHSFLLLATDARSISFSTHRSEVCMNAVFIRVKDVENDRYIPARLSFTGTSSSSVSTLPIHTIYAPNPAIEQLTSNTYPLYIRNIADTQTYLSFEFPNFRSEEYISAKEFIDTTGGYYSDAMILTDRQIRGFFYDDSNTLCYGLGRYVFR